MIKKLYLSIMNLHNFHEIDQYYLESENNFTVHTSYQKEYIANQSRIFFQVFKSIKYKAVSKLEVLCHNKRGVSLMYYDDWKNNLLQHKLNEENIINYFHYSLLI